MTVVKRLFRPVYAPILRRYRNRANLKSQRADIRAQIESCRAAGAPLKVIIGAGSTHYAGWISTDIPAFDVLSDRHWSLFFAPHSIDRLLAEHVFEHFTVAQFLYFLRQARAYLAEGGRIRFAVPDGYHPDSDYIERVRPGGTGQGADDHQVLYNSDHVAEILGQANFEYELLEYFDADGSFHQIDWHPDGGFIGRSADHDDRNSPDNLAYTSLIVDCWPGS